MLEFSAVKLSAAAGKVLLNNVNLILQNGMIALSGSNGVGKSTLLRAIAGLHDLDGGHISLDGIDSRRERAGFHSMMSYMPQNYAAFRDLTGREFMRYLLGLRGVGGKQADKTAVAWLVRVGLTEAADGLTAAYSQGMLQRLGFACSVQIDVKLLLLDEPFAGVDPLTRADLMSLLAELARSRLALVVTHEVDEMVAAGARQVLFIDGDLVPA